MMHYSMDIPKYYIAGDRGLVGTWYKKKYPEALGGNTQNANYMSKISTKTDLQLHKPTHVIINAATVGGLQEDLDKSFELMIKNLTIQNNIFEACRFNRTDRVLLQGSTCSYPAVGEQPYRETQLMQGEPFPTYLPTALPKLMGMYQCRASNEKYDTHWRTAINTNMFGPHDRTGEHAHVIGALMQKFVDACKNNSDKIEIWGSGNQSRDILYIEDAIDAMDIILNNDKYDCVNVASGYEISIKEIAELLIKVSGYKGNLWFNTDRPEGIKNRAISNDRLKELGWVPRFTVEEAFAKTFEWYYDNA